MTSFFLQASDLRSRRAGGSLFAFKMILAALCAFQAAMWICDRGAIFSRDGLLPDELMRIYFPSGVLSFGESLGVPLAWAQMALALLIVFSARLQNLAFLLIFVLEAFLRRRAFLFTNAGDSLLSVLCLFAALTPAVTPRGWRTSEVRLKDLLSLYILYSIIYLQNFYFKLQSSWGRGRGLQDALAHLELARFPLAEGAPPSWLVGVNNGAIVLVFLSAFAPWIHPRYRKVKIGLVLATTLYHVGANVLLSLSWLSLPFLALQVLLFSSEGSPEGKAGPPVTEGRFMAGLFLCLIGFWGLPRVDEMASFSAHGNLLYVHNWNMFAPPPPSTGAWRAELRNGEGRVRSFGEKEIKAQLGLRDSQHEYKYLYNLRRSESFPLRARLGAILCRRFDAGADESLRLVYQARYFETEESKTIVFGEERCSADEPRKPH